MQQQKRAQQAIRRAVTCYERGNLREAELLYGDVLREQPQHFDALQLLGALRIAQRKFDDAVHLIRQAVLIHPYFPKAHYNLGLALFELKRHREALECFDHALVLKPDYAEALIRRAEVLLNLDRPEDALASSDRALMLDPAFGPAYYSHGAALGKLARHDEAMASVERAIALAPESAEAFHQRGMVLSVAGRDEEALASFEQALAMREAYPEALCGRGQALTALDRHDEALESYSRALAYRPDSVEALSNRGTAHAYLSDHEAALADFAAALALAPTHRDTLYNRGVTLVALRRLREATLSFSAAIAACPDDARSISNCGFVLAQQRFYEDAIKCFDQALTLRPLLLEAHINKSEALLRLGRYDEATAACELAFAANPESLRLLEFDVYMYAKQFACLWDGLDEHQQRMLEDVRNEQSMTAPMMLMGVNSDPAQQLICARRFVARRRQLPTERIASRARADDGRIRVAYVSANFNEHPVAHALVGLLEQHDRSRFEIVGLSLNAGDRSDIKALLLASMDEFREVHDQSDAEVAQWMRERGIDIAVDLMGHTVEARPYLFAHRAAPVQVNYLGYPGTMGAPFIDYILADPYVIPPEQSAHYDERVAWLPHSYFPGDSGPRQPQPALTRSREGLPERGFVFCCFNTHYKITPAVFAVWMRLLAAVEGSVLWLQGNNVHAAKNLRREASACGIDPERLIFARRLDRREEHLLRYEIADLFLDTFPYNAHSTACDALWGGLPLVTCSGLTFASRVAGSLLHAAGVPELITTDLGAYEATARAVALDSTRLAEIRARLRANRRTAPLFACDRFARHVEIAFTTMLEIQRRGEPARSFSVPEVQARMS